MEEEKMLSTVAKSLKPSPIQELSHLAQRSNAVNLAEGFPDFPAPEHVKSAAVAAIKSDLNQYRHVQGICDHVAALIKETQNLVIDPLTDVVICCGQTEAFAAAVFAVVDHGDEVILFDPVYETYETSISLAGGIPVFVPLDPPYWSLDPEKLAKAVTTRTKAIVLNSPHNPTGKVFSKDELEAIASVCRTRDCLAITDEVYEHITYDGENHISLASLPEMQRRTIITSSLSKSFSVTGWRVGWAISTPAIASAVRNIHIKLTDSAPAPFQEAALTALQSSSDYFVSLRSVYESKRDFIVNMLSRIGFHVASRPLGSFFVFAELPQDCPLSDVEFVTELIKQAGVVAVPGCGFFHRSSSADGENEFRYENRYIRFAFCKSDETLSEAALRIGNLLDARGRLTLFQPTQHQVPEIQAPRTKFEMKSLAFSMNAT